MDSCFIVDPFAIVLKVCIVCACHILVMSSILFIIPVLDIWFQRNTVR